MKRFFDFMMAFTLLIIVSPIIVFASALVWFQDFNFPFYVSIRYGKNKAPFKMFKLRSMVVHDNAQVKIDTTAADDVRITRVGKWIRRLKIDELPQLINVIKGDMSLVGPRPNVEREVILYTAKENELFLVSPGITDLASIVFFDLAAIASSYKDPNQAYAELVRPWKNRLGLLYVEKHTFLNDILILGLTVVALICRQKALRGVQHVVKKMGGSQQLQRLVLRQDKLVPCLPIGASVR